MHYQKPSIRELGSLRELTAQQFNKIGMKIDVFTVQTAGQVVGSLVPAK